MAYLVHSLVTLRAEIDARWPHRDRRTDGWIGDAAHVGTNSDHNPDSKGAVHAIDVDKDGIVPSAVISACAHHKSVIAYVIWNRQIYSNKRDFVPVAYTGSNPHTDHVHVSALHTAFAEGFGGPWGIAVGISEGIGEAPGPSQGTNVPPVPGVWDPSGALPTGRDTFFGLSAFLNGAATALRSLRK